MQKNTKSFRVPKHFFEHLLEFSHPFLRLFFPPSVRSNSQITLKSENTNKSSGVLHAYMDITLTATIFLDLPKNREGSFSGCRQPAQKKFCFVLVLLCYGILAEMVAWLAIYHFECFTVCFICVTKTCLALFSEK